VTRRFTVTLIFHLVFALPWPGHAESPPARSWSWLAGRLTGVSEEDRRGAIEQLRALPRLSDSLSAALAGPRRFLALEVISSLGLRDFLPALLTLSEHDRSGATLLTLNTLLDGHNVEGVARAYRDRLTRDGGRPRSATAAVIMLDTLGRLGVTLPDSTVRAFLESPSFELRSAALSYARYQILQFHAPRFLFAVETALRSHPYQLRLQADFLIADLPPGLRAVALGFSSTPPPEVSAGPLPSRVLAGGEPQLCRLSPPDFLPPLPRWEAPPSPSCRQTYERFYARPGTEIRIIFGYKDTRPTAYVGDRYERLALVETLLGPCPENFHACGFQRDPDDAERFSRIVPGPDGLPRTLTVRVVQSSVGPDDRENRQDGFQDWQTRQATSAFYDALTGGADAVFYNGHSRDGGGPDFAPPRLVGEEGDVDYEWYAAHHPGLDRLLSELGASSQPPRLLGLFSCVSSGHFAKSILALEKNTALITQRRLLYYADALRSLLGAVSALAGKWCSADFDSAIGAESAGGHALIQGFFGS
jgi:hypothetical protein